jgi:hypothetical protein
LRADIARRVDRNTITQIAIDRGYINSRLVGHVLETGGTVLCKPWSARNGALFRKNDFKFDMRARTVTCPEGQAKRFTLGTVVEFDSSVCDKCPIREKCTNAAPGTGRTLSVAENEDIQHRLRKLIASPSGRAQLRERVKVEHLLAHLSRKQGRRARYIGLRKNVFDLRRRRGGDQPRSHPPA